MPYLKAILMNATDKSNRMLRAKAMECISLVGMAVGKDKFRDDAKQVSYISNFHFNYIYIYIYVYIYICIYACVGVYLIVFIHGDEIS